MTIKKISLIMDGEINNVFLCGKRRNVSGWWSEAASRFCLCFVTGPVDSLLREIMEAEGFRFRDRRCGRFRG
jgi:hypothetical protein